MMQIGLILEAVGSKLIYSWAFAPNKWY